MLKEGIKAPEFSLADQNGQTVRLSDFRGKKVVVYFYSKDHTAGCTKQACAFANNYQAFQSINVPVIGISKDTTVSHGKFAAKYELPFILLADPEKEVHAAYDVLKEKTMYGKKVIGTERTTYIINENGMIEKAMKKVKPDTNAADVLAYLQSL